MKGKTEIPKFYRFHQNNSGGSFVVNDKLCANVVIEAFSSEEACIKAEELGCYWDGVDRGSDCPCCGDRWSKYENTLDIDKMNQQAYPVKVYSSGNVIKDEKEWFEKYGKYSRLHEPTWRQSYASTVFEGDIAFKDVEEYCQFLANEYGWTTPDTRIYYADNTVKEIFIEK